MSINDKTSMSWRLVCMTELSKREIAESCGVGERTVATQRKTLKAILEQYKDHTPGTLAEFQWWQARTEPKGTPEDAFNDYDFEPPIEYLEIGECEDMLGGPAKVAGYYLHPECIIGCCHSKGPFPTKEAALEADRIRWEEIAKATKEGDQV